MKKEQIQPGLPHEESYTHREFVKHGRYKAGGKY